MSEERTPLVGEMVIYRHPASKDPKIPPYESPAVVQKVDENDVLTLCVFAVNGFVAFRKAEECGDKAGQWSWPPARKP